MAKEINFDELYNEIEHAVEVLERGEGSISDNIKLYKQTREKIQKAKKMLEDAENQIKDISSNKG